MTFRSSTKRPSHSVPAFGVPTLPVVLADDRHRDAAAWQTYPDTTRRSDAVHCLRSLRAIGSVVGFQLRDPIDDTYHCCFRPARQRTRVSEIVFAGGVASSSCLYRLYTACSLAKAITSYSFSAQKESEFNGRAAHPTAMGMQPGKPMATSLAQSRLARLRESPLPGRGVHRSRGRRRAVRAFTGKLPWEVARRGMTRHCEARDADTL